MGDNAAAQDPKELLRIIELLRNELMWVIDKGVWIEVGEPRYSISLSQDEVESADTIIGLATKVLRP